MYGAIARAGHGTARIRLPAPLDSAAPPSVRSARGAAAAWRRPHRNDDVARRARPILAHAHRAARAARAEERTHMPAAPQQKRWTLEEMHALPEDGNKYELVYGELWVTPGPTEPHNDIVARLTRILVPYVDAQGLGYVYHPRAVFRVGREVEVEPDLMVRLPHPDPRGSWETAPRPILVVEVVSPSSRRRDYGRKRELYLAQGIPECWIVDGDATTITVASPGREDVVATDRLTWAPAGAGAPLTFELARAFG
jgi:Uma2 family endonuclease